MNPINRRTFFAILTFILLHTNTQAFGQEVTLEDRTTGFSAAASDSFSNQAAGSGRLILFTEITISNPTRITKAMNVSNSTVAAANMYEYAIRSSTSPYGLIDSGPATRISRTSYTNVTHGGNNTNLDEFSFNSIQLQPGLYYIGVYSSDGINYDSIAHTSGDLGPVLAENGGTPFFAPTNYHMFVSYFGIEANGNATGIPALPPWGLLLLGAAMILISRNVRKKRGAHGRQQSLLKKTSLSG